MTQTATKTALQELASGNQWVCFDADKCPYNPATGKKAKANDPATWGMYAQAAGALRGNQGKYRGIGREFLKEQGITGIDLDHCVDENGNLTPFAREVVERLHSYTEYSPSGSGLHIWIYGAIPANLGADPETDGESCIEMKDHGGYWTWTGKHLAGTPETIEDRQIEAQALYDEIRARRKAAKERQRHLRQPRTKVTQATGRDTIYGLKALDGECEQLARTRQGGRNQRLNDSAFSMGQLVGGGELSRGIVERELTAAALRTGLDEREIEKTMRSGLEAGLREPRSAPPREEPRRPNAPAAVAPGNGNGGGTDTPAQGEVPAKQPGRSFNTTDLGNAERLVARYGRDLRYCHAMNAWLVWNGTHWIEDKSGHAERLAKATVRTIYGEAKEEPDEAKRKAIATHAMRSESKKSIKDMLNLAQSEQNMPITREELDADPWLLNCANGTIDLRTGKVYAHQRDDLLTRCLTTAYNPAAQCPRWLAFLDTIFASDEQLIRFIQRALGYALTGDTSEQCFFLLWGKGHNGKSTLLEAVQAILGNYAQSAEFKAFLARDNEGIRNDIARMNGKRLVVARESDKGKRLAEAMIKQLTGGDTITARFLHQEYFDFKPQFKLFLAANHKPEIKGTDLGMWRRVRLIPFTVVISEQLKDKDLPRKLAREAEGILAWLVRGCLDWQREGLGIPDAVLEATSAYRDEMDTIATFLSERCNPKPGANVGATALYRAYKAWCERNGERWESQMMLGTLLAERGYEKARAGQKGSTVYRNIELLPEETEEDEQDLLNTLDVTEHFEGFLDDSTRGPEYEEKTQKSVQKCSVDSKCSVPPTIPYDSEKYRNRAEWLTQHGQPKPTYAHPDCGQVAWLPAWVEWGKEGAWQCACCNPDLLNEV